MPFNLFKYSVHNPHFIWNNEKQEERDGDGEGDRVRKSSWREEEESESERTKCNLSAYSDSQCLKWELTENVEDCSLIGQGHSWHFQAKLQHGWWERMCHNYKLFSPQPMLMSRFMKHFPFFYHICIIFYLDCAVSFKIMLTRLPFLIQGWVDMTYSPLHEACILYITLCCLTPGGTI